VLNRQVTTERMRQEVASGTRDLETFRDDINRFQAQLAEINKIQTVQ
jgi:hypothetical protein